MKDKAKVILTLLAALTILTGCAGNKTNRNGAIRLSDPLVVASLLGNQELPIAPSAEAKIKIVSGDGMPLSAKRLSRDLASMGYKIDRVDVAPYLFKKQTVFYAPGFNRQARELADKISAKGGVKPMTWKSVYDIIIVSKGNNN